MARETLKKTQLETAIENAKTNGIKDAEYEAFEEKFKPKLTTDDCFTPPAVYEAVKDWAVKEYGLEGCEIVRPFYPGGDYENHGYPDGCVVIDNPPFSIVSKITTFYMERGIKFFLFAPTLTVFSVARGMAKYVVVYEDIIYDNGACVATSYVTNLGEYKVIVSPELNAAIKKANEAIKQDKTKPFKLKYDYPHNVITAARLQKIAGRGVGLRIKDGVFIRRLESQKEHKKAIFGGGLLISEKAAAEKAAAEKAAAEKAAAEKAAAAEVVYWELSEHEREIIKALE